MAENEQFIPLSCADPYISLLATDEQLVHSGLLKSDAELAEELQFQAAILGSIAFSNTNPSSSQNKGLTKEKKGSRKEINKVLRKEKGESSRFFCEICAEREDYNQTLFSVQKCNHQYCTDCIAKYIAVKVQKSVPGPAAFDCPGLGCKGVLEIDFCRGILPKQVLSMWDDAICESMIDSAHKFYCPYKDCSGLIVNDGGGVIRESECPFCHRLFCAKCKVPWHSGLECRDREEDLMVIELAKKKKWQRCPRCKFFVDKMYGCLHMTCRCGYQFCYACGATWSSRHYSCQRL